MLVRWRSLRQLVCGTCPLGCLRPAGTPGHSLIRCSQPCESTRAAGPGAPWLPWGGEVVLKEGKFYPQSAAKGLGPGSWSPQAVVRPTPALVTFGLGSEPGEAVCQGPVPWLWCRTRLITMPPGCRAASWPRACGGGQWEFRHWTSLFWHRYWVVTEATVESHQGLSQGWPGRFDGMKW